MILRRLFKLLDPILPIQDCGAADQDWRCTRPKGHDGDHITCYVSDGEWIPAHSWSPTVQAATPAAVGGVAPRSRVAAGGGAPIPPGRRCIPDCHLIYGRNCPSCSAVQDAADRPAPDQPLSAPGAPDSRDWGAAGAGRPIIQVLADVEKALYVLGSFAPASDAARVWRRITFEELLPEISAHLDGTENEEGKR